MQDIVAKQIEIGVVLKCGSFTQLYTWLWILYMYSSTDHTYNVQQSVQLNHVCSTVENKHTCIEISHT